MITMLISIASGQQMPPRPPQPTPTQQPGQPQFKAPPGYTTKIESKTSTYNFYPMKRGLPMPYDRMPLPKDKIPKGFSLSTTMLNPSPKAEGFYNDPAKVISSFGAPSRKSFQAFKGKGGDGVVLFFEYSAGLPMDEKDVLAKYLFNKTTPPDPNTQKEAEQFMLADNLIVIWCFRNPKSEVRLAHQQYVFELISEVAQKVTPKK